MPHNKSGFMSPKQNYLWIWKLDTCAIWYHFCTKKLKISSNPRFKGKWENEMRRENWKNPSSRSFVWSCQEKWWYLVLFALYSLAKCFLFFLPPEFCHVLLLLQPWIGNKLYYLVLSSTFLLSLFWPFWKKTNGWWIAPDDPCNVHSFLIVCLLR